MQTSQPASMPRPATIELWFEFGSMYSYLAVMRIEKLAHRAGVAVAWKPFLLGPISKSLGWSSSPFLVQKEKGEYVWQGLARRCRKYGVAWTKPSQFPRRALLPARVALLAAEQPWIAEFCGRVIQLNFVDDRDIDSPETVSSVLAALGLPAHELLAEANSAANRQRLHEQTEEARRRGVFGAPTLFVGTEMFWGNDRLEDALAFAAGSVAASHISPI